MISGAGCCFLFPFACSIGRVEAAAVVLGASSVTTVEYNDLTYDHPSMSTVLVSNVEDSLDDYRHRYDMAISVSRCLHSPRSHGSLGAL